jgi:hypothetical protein
MGAKAGRKGSRSYNILTCGVGAWRKYLDKTRRKTAKRFAIEEQKSACSTATCGWIRSGEYWCHCGGAYLNCKRDDPECICGLIEPNKAACRCGCGWCCPEDQKL